jgi:hypothetical protein
MDINSNTKGLPIDFHEISLIKKDDKIIGKGTLSLNSDGFIELKLFPDNPKEFTIETFFKEYAQSNADAGKLLSQESYFTLTGTAVNDDHYSCKRILITDHNNLRVFTGKVCSDLIISNESNADSFRTARIQIPYKINIPPNRVYEAVKKYSDKWINRSASKNIFEVKTENSSIIIFPTADTTNILIQNSDTEISENDIDFVISTTEFITSSIIDRYSVEYERTGIYKRIFRYSSPQRRDITKGNPPLSISISIDQLNYTRLFIRFHQFVKERGCDPITGLVRRVISAQKAYINGYALSITTAIEAILHSYYSTGTRNISKNDIDFTISELDKTELREEIKRRLIGTVNNIFGQKRADDIIRDLIDKGALEKRYYESWKTLRNSVNHGKEPTNDFQEYLNLCETNLVFFHILILRLIGYTGYFTDYSNYGFPLLKM